jgi:hypothetical protein
VSERTRTPEAVVLVLLALLAGGALLLGGGGSRGGAPARRPAAVAIVSPAHVALVERRVAALRGLRFLHPVPVRVVSPAQLRALGLAENRRAQPLGEQRAQEELLKLLGLLAPREDLGRIAGSVLSEQVAGLYDPRSKQLLLVRGAGVDDVTLAHELTHALEDQHFAIGRLDAGGFGDAATAQQALVEGSATALMLRYAQRYPGDGPSLGQALSSLGSSTKGIPPAILRELLFPYEAGAAFVSALLLDGGRDWSLVDNAERFRPPVSSAEILHPRRWALVQRPLPVRLPDVGRALGGGWRRVLGGSFGEEDTRELLHDALGAGGAALAAAGWRGGAVALWRRGPLPDPACAAPCAADDALLIRWRTANARAAARLAAGLRRWIGATAPRSAAVVATRGSAIALSLAPIHRLASGLAR